MKTGLGVGWGGQKDSELIVRIAGHGSFLLVLIVDLDRVEDPDVFEIRAVFPAGGGGTRFKNEVVLGIVAVLVPTTGLSGSTLVMTTLPVGFLTEVFVFVEVLVFPNFNKDSGIIFLTAVRNF